MSNRPRTSADLDCRILELACRDNIVQAAVQKQVQSLYQSMPDNAGIDDILDKPQRVPEEGEQRCPKFVQGEQCCLVKGHKLGHFWAGGD